MGITTGAPVLFRFMMFSFKGMIKEFFKEYVALLGLLVLVAVLVVVGRMHQTELEVIAKAQLEAEKETTECLVDKLKAEKETTECLNKCLNECEEVGYELNIMEQELIRMKVEAALRIKDNR